MSMERFVQITCDQTGEVLEVRDGTEYPNSTDCRGRCSVVFRHDSSLQEEAARFAFVLGWTLHSRRQLDGHFKSYSEPFDRRTGVNYINGWWVAPGVEPLPDYTLTAQAELDRRNAGMVSLDSQIDRLSAEIDRLRQLRTKAVARWSVC